MPIMAYYCKECGKTVEYLRFKRQKADKNPYCYDCSKRMTRMLHPASLRFKGGGWTVNKPKEED